MIEFLFRRGVMFYLCWLGVCTVCLRLLKKWDPV